mmetsp:Transcript_84188/g.176186  ORF Transcript_84188/g.176186 Transcript_84188/m.176186 type:complete len:469 (-) Transcript_84188:197-1603(-)
MGSDDEAAASTGGIAALAVTPPPCQTAEESSASSSGGGGGGGAGGGGVSLKAPVVASTASSSSASMLLQPRSSSSGGGSSSICCPGREHLQSSDSAVSTASSRRYRPRTTITQVEVANVQYLKEAPRYLIAGAVLGSMGFLVCAVPWSVRMLQLLLTGKDIEKSDVPATVSEMVSVWDTTEARVFFGFELMAAILILLSWYPFKLRNACCIPIAGGCEAKWFFGSSWASVRQFCPSVGLVLVACCPTVKVVTGAGCGVFQRKWDCDKQEWCTWNSTGTGEAKCMECTTTDCMERQETLADMVLVAVHGVSALMMFASFLLCEAHTLGVQIPFTQIRPFKCHADIGARASLIIGSTEYKWRLGTWWLAFVMYCTFIVWTVIVSARDPANPSRKMNFCSFLSEVVAGLSMLTNHGIIWYYSSERKWHEEVLEKIEEASHSFADPFMNDGRNIGVELTQIHQELVVSPPSN